MMRCIFLSGKLPYLRCSRNCRRPGKLSFSNLFVLQNLPKEKTQFGEQRRAEGEKIQLEKPLRLRSEKNRQWFEKKQERDEEKAKKLQEEKEFSDRIKQERSLSRDKHGIERFFTPDMNNEIDREIVHRIKELTSSSNHTKNEENICRRILVRRLSTGVKCSAANKAKVDSGIELSTERRCKKYQKMWNETVRELFCIEFNVKQPTNNTTDIKVAQKINM